MLLQKTYVSDPISKHARVNRGELPMYHVVDSHEAIIDKSTFEKVRQEISLRSIKGRKKASDEPVIYPFTSMLRCGVCGGSYRRKHTAIGKKYDKIVWICNTFNSLGKDMCASRQIPESILIEKATEILGLEKFEVGTLRALVREIVVLPRNCLRFILYKGNEIEVGWQNPSRRESWTEEMKQIARDRQNAIIERRKNDERTTSY